VIVVDPPPPVEAAGSSLLYSREFYGAARKRLEPDGIVQQWLPGGADSRSRAAVAKALRSAFPHVRVFHSAYGWGLHFLASGAPIADARARELADRLPVRAVDDLLEWDPGSTAEAQFELVLARELPVGIVMALDRDVPALQDDLPVNEYYLVRAALRVLQSRDDAR
jgi:hypothetical protein